MLLDLFPLALVFVLFWKIRYVSFNTEYLSLTTSKYIKGWLSLVIVLHHLSQCMGGISLLLLFTGVGYLAVAGFFFFSGFGCQKRYMTDPDYASRFLGKRLPSLFVPYVIATVCYIVVQACYGIEPAWWLFFFPWDKGHTLLPHAWYIFAVAVFYLVFYGLMKCFKQQGKWIIWGVIVYSVVQVAFCMAYGYGSWWTISTAALPFGVFCAWKEKTLTRFLRNKVAMLSIIVFGVYLKAFLPYLPWKVLGCNINSIVVVLMLLLFSTKFKIGNKMLAFLGNIYLEIYLLHGIFIRIIFVHRPSTNISNNFLGCLIVLTGSIVGAYLLHQLCKKPLQTYQEYLKQRTCALKTGVKS